MTAHKYMVTAIAPAADLPLLNLAAERMGWGSGVFSLPLAATASGPATWRAYSTPMRPETVAVLTDTATRDAVLGSMDWSDVEGGQTAVKAALDRHLTADPPQLVIGLSVPSDDPADAHLSVQDDKQQLDALMAAHGLVRVAGELP